MAEISPGPGRDEKHIQQPHLLEVVPPFDPALLICVARSLGGESRAHVVRLSWISRGGVQSLIPRGSWLWVARVSGRRGGIGNQHLCAVNARQGITGCLDSRVLSGMIRGDNLWVARTSYCIKDNRLRAAGPQLSKIGLRLGPNLAKYESQMGLPLLKTVSKLVQT